MKVYEKPSSELILLTECDIILTSIGTEGTQTPFIDMEEESGLLGQ